MRYVIIRIQMEIIPQLLLVLILVLLNGFFVASEFALVSVRKTRIDELVNKGSKPARLVQKSIANLDTFISATQLGITVASLALGWIGEPAVAHFLEPLLASILPQNAAIISSHGLSITIAFAIITFLHIVLGELAPKTVALQRAEITSLLIIAPLSIFTTVFKPFIWILNSAGNLVLKMIGLTAPSAHQLVHSEEEIKMILAQSAEEGAIGKEEAEMVYSVLKLGDVPVKQIMIPRTEIIAFDIETTIRTVIKIAEQNLHSRFPVYSKSIDNIVGFVHVKDIYRSALQEMNVSSIINLPKDLYRKVLKRDEDKRISQTKTVRQILQVPDSRRIDDVLLDMRRERVHIAVVNDEYGGTSGIVTLEDIVESLVGEIQDEFEKPVKDIEQLKNGKFLVDGLTSVERVSKKFGLGLKGQGYATIAGFVFGLIGRSPKPGNRIRLGNTIMQVNETDGRRIKNILLWERKPKSA